MISRHATDDHSQHPSGQDGARQAASATDDALDGALAEMGATEAQALRWLVRRADGLDAATEAEFQAWRKADPSHQAAFDDIADVWGGFDDIPADGVAQLKAAVALARSAEPVVAPPARVSPENHPPRPAKTSSPRQWVRGLAQWAPQALAAGVAFAMLGGGWFGWSQWQQQPVFSQHYATARGQQLEAKLPDGSMLRLDTASQADVTLYRQRREVRLPEGQIMFAVKGDKARPFDVLAGAMRITAVGTRFSVRYTPSLGGNQVQVAVEEGHVRVARADAAKRGGDDALLNASTGDVIDLTAGQTVAVDGEGRLGQVHQVAAEGIAPWRGNRVNFDNMPLAAAVAELERYGSTGLLVRDPAVSALRVTGSVDLRRVSDFARSLPQVLPVRLEPQGGTTFEVVARRP